eukprot:467696_1
MSHMSHISWECKCCGLLNRHFRRQCQACFRGNPNVPNVHERTLRDKWYQIISSALPSDCQIDIVIQIMADFAYPIHFGVYAAFPEHLIYINRDGRCKYKYANNQYWDSPLSHNNDFGGTIKMFGTNYFHKLGKKNIKYHEFEKWDYDFTTNTLTLYGYDEVWTFMGNPATPVFVTSWAVIFVGELCYGNVASGKELTIQPDSYPTKIEQSEYEWNFTLYSKSHHDVPLQIVKQWNDASWNTILKLSDRHEFFFMEEL